MMVFRDSEQKRMLYFSAYVVYVAILTSFRLMFVVWDHDEKVIVTDFCHGIDSNFVKGDATNWAKNTEYTSFEDCKEKVGQTILLNELLYAAIGLLVQVHFALVLYTHYKNSHLVKSKGGCMEDVGQP